MDNNEDITLKEGFEILISALKEISDERLSEKTDAADHYIDEMQAKFQKDQGFFYQRFLKGFQAVTKS